MAEQREVSGAIGAAMLSREYVGNAASKFKGFRQVVESPCNLSTFVCKACDNNCTITRMQVPGEKPTFYGSRCDLYDSSLSQSRTETYFDEREKLLLQGYHEGANGKITVGCIIDSRIGGITNAHA